MTLPKLPGPVIWALAFLPFVLVSIFVGLGFTTGGGASSPEDAATGLLSAAVEGDALAVIALVDPNEVEIFKPITSELTERFGDVDLDIGNEEQMEALDTLEAIDVRLSNVEVETQQVREGVTRVIVVDGTLRMTINPDKLPRDLRESYEESVANGEVERVVEQDLASLVNEATDGESQSTFLVSVERDGRWYVSIAYTIAEYAREAAGIDYVDGIAPGSAGAASPDEAITQLVAALPSTDPKAAVGLLPPDAYSVLYDYVGVINEWMVTDGVTDDGEALTVLGLLGGKPDTYSDYYSDPYTCYDEYGRIDTCYDYGGYDEVEPDDPRIEGVSYAVSDLQTTKKDLGDGMTRVSLVAATITVTDRDGDQSVITYADRCVTYDDGDTTECLDDMEAELTAPDPSAVVVEVDGRYYVDPFASLVDYGVQFLDQVTDADIDCFVANLEADAAVDDEYDRLVARAERLCADAPLGDTILGDN